MSTEEERQGCKNPAKSTVLRVGGQITKAGTD